MKERIGIIIIVVIIISTSLLTRGFFNRLKTNAAKINFDSQKIIKQPKLYLYIGIGGIIIFLAIGMFFLFGPEDMIADYEDEMRVPVFILFLIICIPYIFIILFQVNWKIEIGESSFIFRNIFGIKREYQFVDVEIKYKKSCTRFYRNKKHILGVSFLQENHSALDIAIEIYKSKKVRSTMKKED